ncbi:N-acetylmuramoyl-L-alanine amidase [Pseudobutyrivibrio sp. YE44]|uniref:N-acetylmuramoyl-L-alanine amidase family protein n=1 Tax=Pseudobutyrivibrio sp. YE44 TaxID=1520802 RepID=UPI00088A5D3E|nr:N-acetylmuramoyl-L-alanine amidase [Pseudobutyrivibrio sp. YE44]SDB21337.1 N-acetylmuramoyl-L-alanine amidase [Pseudobutyrivibrio sp. YE44]
MKKNLKAIRAMGMVMLLFITFVVTGITAEAKGADSAAGQKLVVINPGCQAVDSAEKESIGPGAWTWVADDMVGAEGVLTGNREYDINLKIAVKTAQQLKDMGYKVELVRTYNDVDINNMERAMVANTMVADIYVSIYSSGDNKKEEGVKVTCETKDNPYNFSGYNECRLLADTIVGSLGSKIDGIKTSVVESDDVMGINWCKSPNAIVRVGNLKNEADDEKLATEEYQQTLAEGIAAGVDSYFTQK